jgi:hypothetical protein
MKIITAMSPRTPAIRPARMPLIRVCARGRGGAGGEGRAGGAGGVCGAEPLGEGGGSVVVSGAAGVSVMDFFFPEWERPLTP